MHPRIVEIHAYLVREGENLHQVLLGIPEKLTGIKPSPESYSVAEVVQHLAITERRVTALLAKGVAEALARGVGPDPETAPILPTIDVTRVLDRSKRIRNPRADPTGFMHVGHAFGDLTAADEELSGLLYRTDLPDLREVSANHPAFGPLNGYEWAAFVAAHTHRHTEQILEIVATLNAK